MNARLVSSLVAAAAGEEREGGEEVSEWRRKLTPRAARRHRR